MVVFLWKTTQGLVKGYNVTTLESARRGRFIVPKTVVGSSPASVRHARETSLGVKGAQMFNLLPASIRNHNSTDVNSFKVKLDLFLSQIPDQPTISEQTRAAKTNSLLHQIPMMTTQYEPC